MIQSLNAIYRQFADLLLFEEEQNRICSKKRYWYKSAMELVFGRKEVYGGWKGFV